MPYAGIMDVSCYRQFDSCCWCDDWCSCEWCFCEDFTAGTGAFFIEEAIIGHYLKITRFDNHFRGAPWVKHFHFIVMPDFAVRAAALKAGDVDIALDLLPQDAWDIYSYWDNLSVIASNDFQTSFLQFNMNSLAINCVFVRRAIAYALDKEFLSHIFSGTPADDHLWGVHLSSYLNTGAKPFNTLSAKDMLNNAGYYLCCCENWIHINGEPFPTLSLLVPAEDILLTEKAWFISDMLSQLGIHVEINPVPQEDFCEYLKNGYFDIILLNKVADNLLALYQLYVGGEIQNYGNFNSEVINYLFDKAFSTLCPMVSQLLFWEIQYELSYHMPVLSLVSQPRYIAFHNSLQGISFSACRTFLNLREVWLLCYTN